MRVDTVEQRTNIIELEYNRGLLKFGSLAYSSYNDIRTYFNVKISGQISVTIMYTYR